MSLPSPQEDPWNQPFDGTATADDVLSCFRLLLGRHPTRPEWPAHSGAFVGKPLDAVVPVYLESPEFKNRKLLRYSADNVDYVPLDGYGMYVSRDDLVVGSHVKASGSYEPEVTAAFRRILRPGMRVIDVGANIGWFSCLSASIVGPEGRVVAVEAGEVNLKMLMMSRARNGWQHLQVLGAAASDRFGTLLYSSNSANGFVHEPRDIEEIAAGAIVPAVPLSPLVEDGKPWHLVKIDVEGYEYKVLRGLEPTITAHRPALCVEFSPPSIRNVSGLDGEAFLRWFLGRGYRFEVLAPGGPVACGTDAGRVLDAFDRASGDHIDLLALP